VADAAVAGAPSEQWGETVVAYVVPAPDADPEAVCAGLAAWCEERLVGYKRPREWRVIGSVPRNALGKVLRHQLG
jgi:acyl-CoA synthetase (AMP-forming)/AMP-acid ligase II